MKSYNTEAHKIERDKYIQLCLEYLSISPDDFFNLDRHCRIAFRINTGKGCIWKPVHTFA